MSRPNEEYKGTDPKETRYTKHSGGEHHNGRKSQFKNTQREGEAFPREYNNPN